MTASTRHLHDMHSVRISQTLCFKVNCMWRREGGVTLLKAAECSCHPEIRLSVMGTEVALPI